jgi:hypothetical protein
VTTPRSVGSSFRVSCDHAEGLIESIRQHIGSKCLVDEATGSASARSVAAPGIKPISVVRLEQMSKAIRWLVIELQHSASILDLPPTPCLTDCWTTDDDDGDELLLCFTRKGKFHAKIWHQEETAC